MGPTKPIKPFSVDYEVDFEDLNTDYSSDLSKILENEINNEIMYQIMNKQLTESGYHYCYCKDIIPDEWVKENIRGDKHNFGSHWFFKEQADAAIFQLRWFNEDKS